MTSESLEEEKNEPLIEKRFEPASNNFCFIDITLFVSAVLKFYSVTDKKIKKGQIEKIIAGADWYHHYQDKSTGNRVLSESVSSVEHKHELHTAIYLARFGYDVLFAPKGMFARHEKKFDVFLIKGIVMLKADFKTVHSQNPDTIANRIKEGSNQASRIVLHILSDVGVKVLIEGMRSGCYKNSTIKEILLLYKGCLYILPKNLIISKNIFSFIK